jgi:hypothetical protein
VSLPVRLRQLYEVEDGRYDEQGQWWVVWPLSRVVTVSSTGWADGSLPETLVALGDDGTGNAFCMPVNGRDDVLRWSWIDGDVERSEGTWARFAAEWAPDA